MGSLKSNSAMMGRSFGGSSCGPRVMPTRLDGLTSSTTARPNQIRQELSKTGPLDAISKIADFR